MKFRMCLTVISIACLCVSNTYAKYFEVEPEPPKATMVHIPVTSLRQNEKLTVEARVDGALTRVVFMRLYYKPFGASAFRYVEMSRGGAGYFGELPSRLFPGAKVYYFILALMEDQAVVTYPANNPYGNPIEVQVASDDWAVPIPQTSPQVSPALPKSDHSEAGENPMPDRAETSRSANNETSPVLLLSPGDGEEFDVDDEIVIAISLLPDADEPIDLNSINLFVDRMNVTIDADISENLITYTASSLPPGRHAAFVQGYFKSGLELPKARVLFRVKGKKKRDLNPAEELLTGRVFAESRHENISSRGFHDSNIGGVLSGQRGKLKYSGRLYLTTREDGRFQPRNRASLNVEVPMAGITIGDVYPRFHDLMLWGKRVRGIHGRVHLGAFNVDVVTGQTFRQVGAFVVDTTGNRIGNALVNMDTTTIVSGLGTFDQNLFGLRTSFGSGKNFQLGLNLVKVKDDSSSLGYDALGRPLFLKTPQDNLVVGTDLRLGFAQNRIEFKAGAAYSLITDDIYGGAISKAALNQAFPTLGVDIDPSDFSNLLIINLSTRPLQKPTDGRSVALNTSFRFDFFKNNFVIGYKQIGSEYVSLGNSFLRSNLRGFYFQDRIRLLQDKLYLNLGYESYNDNFDADDANNPTQLNTINSGFTVYPARGWPSFTFNLRNYNRNKNFNATLPVAALADTSRENNTTNDYSIQMNHDTQLFNLNHQISFSYIASNRSDVFLPSGQTSSNIEVMNVRTQYQIPLVTTFSFARNDNRFGSVVDTSLSTFKFNMIGLKAEYPFLQEKLRTYAGINFTSASGATSGILANIGAVTNYKRSAFNFGARYEIAPGHFVSSDASLISFNDNGQSVNPQNPSLLVANPSFTDSIFRIYYERRF